MAPDVLGRAPAVLGSESKLRRRPRGRESNLISTSNSTSALSSLSRKPPPCSRYPTLVLCLPLLFYSTFTTWLTLHTHACNILHNNTVWFARAVGSKNPASWITPPRSTVSHHPTVDTANFVLTTPVAQTKSAIVLLDHNGASGRASRLVARRCCAGDILNSTGSRTLRANSPRIGRLLLANDAQAYPIAAVCRTIGHAAISSKSHSNVCSPVARIEKRRQLFLSGVSDAARHDRSSKAYVVVAASRPRPSCAVSRGIYETELPSPLLSSRRAVV